MRIDEVTLRIRAASTSLGDRIAGAAELANAEAETLSSYVPCGFVVQTGESATPNESDSGVLQLLTEHFSVVVALDNSGDTTGNIAHNELDDIREELWGAILGFLPTGFEYPIQYDGASTLDVSRSFLFYKYDFSAKRRVTDDDAYRPSIPDDLTKIYGEAPDHGIDIDSEDSEIDSEFHVDLEGAGS